MPKRSSKKPPTDISLIAHRIIEEAIGEPLTPPKKPTKIKKPTKEKNPAAVALGRLGGKKGGPARAKKLSAEKRKAIAKLAAWTRWGIDR